MDRHRDELREAEGEGESRERETTPAGWPLTVLAASGFVFSSVWLAFVLPSFGRMYDDLGTQLSAVTEFLVSTHPLVWIAGGLAVGAFLILKNRLLLRSAALVIDGVALAVLALGTAVVVIAVFLPLIGTIGNLQ